MSEQRKINSPKLKNGTMKDLYVEMDIRKDVIEFAREKNIFNEIDTTINIYNAVFGINSVYNMYLRWDPEGEDMENNGFVVFEIEFEGDPKEFKIRYRKFVKEWLSIVPESRQEYIDFAFHING